MWDVVWLYIGDMGLFDYVLKLMNNVIVGSYIVCCVVNLFIWVLEYMIYEFGNCVLINELEFEIVFELFLVFVLVFGVDVYSDVVYLYINVLLLYWVIWN